MLCNEESVPLHKIGPGIGIQAPGFSFSAYLKSTYVSHLNQLGMLELATLDAPLNEAVENAKAELRDHFKARSKEKLKGLVDEWKKEEVYPYKEEPKNPVQKVERQVFDLVAVTTATNLPDFQTQDRRNRKFQLRMLKQAIERGPEQLQLILEEVLELSQQKQEELAKLLKQTTLTSIINASVTVADRLNFLSGLEAMLFDKDLKETFKERSQLHQILKDNTWVFGKEFALTVSDQSLTKVLVEHAKAKKLNVVIDEPIKRPGGRKGIIDLMLSRKIPTNTEEELSHLVVELKRIFFSFIGFVALLVISIVRGGLRIETGPSHATGVSAMVAGILEALLDPITLLVIAVAFVAATWLTRKTSKRTSTS
jgi:hypothetical protein